MAFPSVFAEFPGIRVVMFPPISATSNNFKRIFAEIKMLTENNLKGEHVLNKLFEGF